MIVRVLTACFGVICLAACSAMPSAPSLPTLPVWKAADAEAESKTIESDAPAIKAAATPREHVDVALKLLGEGKAEEAKRHLTAALASTPDEPTALKLMKQIEVDPVALLGAPAGEHLVVSGETMSGLAKAYLGDPLMFYALARYNGLDAPNALAAGQMLKVPTPGKQALAGAAAAPKAEASSSLSRTARAADVDRASAVRLQALESLNSGDVARAVALLKQAQALNEADPAIQRDLDRALRIQSALKDG